MIKPQDCFFVYTNSDCFLNNLYKGIVKMDIRYKRLTEKELNTFIHMRINQLREEGAKEEIDWVD